MKYLKKFESFSSNENNEMEDLVSSKINSLSDSEIEEVKSDLLELADNLGLSPEELTDEEKVKSALSKSGLKLESLAINEGLKDWWARSKNKFYNFLTKFGIGGILSGIITTAIGSNMMSDASTLADYTGQDVAPNSTVIIGGAAIVISLIATIVGMQKSEGPKNKPTHRYRVGGGAPL